MPRAFASAGIGSLLLSLLVAAGVAPVPREVPAGQSALVAVFLPLETQALGVSGVGKGAWKQPPSSVKVQLPSEASGSVELQVPGAKLGFRLGGARPAAVVSSEHGVRFPGALGEGTELELRAKEQGVEDLVHFERRPAQERVDYLVDLRGVAGVRKVGEVVEFVDEGGAPRLRMEAPYVVSARGEVVRGRVEVGCEHDEEARGPWGRKAVKGGEECRVSVEWGGRGVEYPAVLDPVWSAATSMSTTRTFSVFGRLGNGQVLVTGGRTCNSGNCVRLKTTELFDPGTGTWAQGAALSGNHDAGASVVVSGGILAIGCDSKVESEARFVELYEEGTGSWVTLPSMAFGRQETMALLTADKKQVVVLGGLDPSTNLPIADIEIFDLASQTWSPGGLLNQPRYLGSVTGLPDGKILVAGGTTCGNCGPVADVEIYDPLTQSSQKSTNLLVPHFGHTAVSLQIQGKTRVLVAGGGSQDCELFDPDTSTWTFTGKMATSRVYSAPALLSDGSYVVAGGILVPTFEANTLAERFDPTSLTWKPAGQTPAAHGAPAFALLSGDRLLVAGGTENNFLTGTITSKTVSIFQAQAQAQFCEGSGECISGFCADNVCCESACTGVCMACSAAKKGGGADGVCGAIALNTDPDSECEAQDKSTCGTSGECDGKGACAKYAVNTPCGTATCTDGVSTGLLCSAGGKCLQQVASCAPFLCKDPTACLTSCVSDEQCTQSAHCAGQVCVGDLGQGEACTRGAECGSGFCVDGVCCESACEGTCQACAGKLKEGGGADGVCGPALADSDPHDDCADEPLLGCDKNGLCDGKGACAIYAAGVECQPPTCAGDGQGGFRLQVFACDGSGTCASSQGQSCGVFGCEQGSCRTTCAADTDCAEGAYCLGNSCVVRKDLGASCGASNECLGGLCVDGVCCSSPCGGPCEACNKEGALGLCVPVSGKPLAGHPSCPEVSPDKPCEQLVCDGINREVCAVFVGPEVSCRAPSCADGVAVQAAVCDGKGACPEQETARCEPFVCSGDTCGAGCTSDKECDRRFQCDTTQGDCIPRTVAVCDGDHTLTNPDGTTTDCAPFGCEGSSCKAQCSSVSDCVLPNVCDEATRSCIPAPPNPSDSAGCQFTPVSSQGTGAGLLGLVGVLLLRRRRRGSSGSCLV